MRIRGCMLLIFIIMATALSGRPDNFIPDTTAAVPSRNISYIPAEIPIAAASLPELPDSIAPRSGTYADNYWVTRLRRRNLNLQDSAVIYPRFLNFCIGVYRWFDRVFNYHDTTYVKGDGRLGKIYLISDNWVDAYSFKPSATPKLRMLSDMYANLGIRAKYSILSLGYSFNLNTLISGENPDHNKWDFGISTALFNLEAHIWRNHGGTYIRQFANFRDGKLVKLYFEGLEFDAVNVTGYYMFNNKRFSMDAAHSFSNDQRISAGTAMAGVDFSTYSVNIDFTQLPHEIKQYYTYPLNSYRFHYQTYRLCGGYSYNFVINPHLVINLTALPAVGVTRSDFDSSIGYKWLMSLGGHLTGAISYCNKRFFAGMSADGTFNSFMSDDVDFFSVIQNYRAVVGIKF